MPGGWRAAPPAVAGMERYQHRMDHRRRRAVRRGFRASRPQDDPAAGDRREATHDGLLPNHRCQSDHQRPLHRTGREPAGRRRGAGIPQRFRGPAPWLGRRHGASDHPSQPGCRKCRLGGTVPLGSHRPEAGNQHAVCRGTPVGLHQFRSGVGTHPRCGLAGAGARHAGPEGRLRHTAAWVRRRGGASTRGLVHRTSPRRHGLRPPTQRRTGHGRDGIERQPLRLRFRLCSGRHRCAGLVDRTRNRRPFGRREPPRYSKLLEPDRTGDRSHPTGLRLGRPVQRRLCRHRRGVGHRQSGDHQQPDSRPAW